MTVGFPPFAGLGQLAIALGEDLQLSAMQGSSGVLCWLTLS